ncbi:hypothetical protein BJ166DRAFT_520784 [Pestalotiopsis sp. NC0098]|nr:hypothetical protein BJ166DRAFT_520784 [Pestalotiopsis sp. NC0098]
MTQFLKLLNDWFRPKLEASENPLEQFERLWGDQKSGARINFMSIAFNTSTTGSINEIKDLGLSHWSKRSIQQQSAYHWCIGEKVETKDIVEFGNPDTFDFGTTQAITAHDVKTVLDDWALSLSDDCEELCIVMYGKQAIETLGRHWKAPVPATILDLEAVWHQRHHRAVFSTFEEVASASKDVVNVTSNIDQAGNQAYCLIALLKSLGKKDKSSQRLGSEERIE